MRPRHPWTQLVRDRQGLALVEFAIVAPLFILMFLSGYVLFDALSANRKVTAVARTVADLTTRYSSVTSSDLSTIMAASTQILWPYSNTQATVRVSEVLVASTTSATVVWSQAQNTTARNVGSTVTIPSGLASTGTYLVLGEAGYAYVAPISYRGFRTMSLNQSIYMVPRKSGSIPLS
jgi:Flp pilus assembly protein TadG